MSTPRNRTSGGASASLVGLLVVAASLASGCGQDEAARTGKSDGKSSDRQAPLAGRVVVIDPGHNGGNASNLAESSRLVDIGTKMKACDATGTETESGYSEAAYNWDVSQRLAKFLRERGARVVLTRSDNSGVGPCITERAAIGNRAQADVALSIHADGGPPGGRGFHVIVPATVQGFTDDIAADSMRLGEVMRTEFRRRSGIPFATYIGEGKAMTVRDDLGGLNLSDVPKVFLETGNMKNQADAALFETPVARQRIAESAAGGIIAFLSSRDDGSLSSSRPASGQ